MSPSYFRVDLNPGSPAGLLNAGTQWYRSVLFAGLILCIFSCGRISNEGFARNDLPQGLPPAETDLLIEGNLAESEVRLDLDSLTKLPPISFTAIDPWDGLEHSYRGVSLLKLLNTFGPATDVSSIEVQAGNGYSAPITWDDLTEYGYILAYEMDGELLETSNKLSKRGKLMIALDFSQDEAPDMEIYKHQLVWQVSRILVE